MISSVSQPPPEYEEAFLAYQQADYERSERLLNQIISTHRGSPSLADAQWLLARSLEGRFDLASALNQYRLFVINYPEDPRRREALVQIEILSERLRILKTNPRVRLAAVIEVSGSRLLANLDGWMGGLKAAGADTIIVKGYRESAPLESSGVFFQTDHAPVILDALDPVVRAARSHRLSVWVWMSVRRMEWKLKSTPGWGEPDQTPGRGGSIRAGNMDLFHPGAFDYLLELHRDLARYPIDGIVFGADLFPQEREGMSTAALHQFAADFGGGRPEAILREELLDPRRGLYWRWVGWKSRMAVSYLGRLMGAMEEVNPTLQFGMMFSEDAVLDPLAALTRHSQDLLEARRHALDYYIFAADGGLENPGKNPVPNPAPRLASLADLAVRLVGDPEKILIHVGIVQTPRKDFEDLLMGVAAVNPAKALRLHRSRAGAQPGAAGLLFNPKPAESWPEGVRLDKPDRPGLYLPQ